MKDPFPIPSPVDDLPDDVRTACFTLVAYMANTGKVRLHVNMEGLKAEGVSLGDFEVNVQRTDV